MKTAAFLPLTLVLAACASTGDPAAAGPAASDPAADAAMVAGRLDPVGAYTVTTSIQGRSVEGRLEIHGSPNAYGGSLYTAVTGPLPLSSVRVDGQTVNLTADTPDGTVYIRLLFNGPDAFTGDWTLGPEGGAIRGRRADR